MIYVDCTEKYNEQKQVSSKDNFKLVECNDRQYLKIYAIDLDFKIDMDIPLMVYFPINSMKINKVEDALNYLEEKR